MQCLRNWKSILKGIDTPEYLFLYDKQIKIENLSLKELIRVLPGRRLVYMVIENLSLKELIHNSLRVHTGNDSIENLSLKELIHD